MLSNKEPNGTAYNEYINNGHSVIEWYTWDGDPIVKTKIKGDISSFDVDEQRKVLYVLDNESTESEQINSIDLSNYL